MVRKIFSGLILVLFWPLVVYSYGISTPFGEVRLENLRIGGTYSVAEMFNFPLKINYDGDVAVKLKITVTVPSTTTLEGFEVIPDTGWIKIDQDEFFLTKEKNEAITDVKVTIPDDKSLMGKKFYAKIHSEIMPADLTGMVMGAGLNSRLLITIADKPLSEEEKKKLEEKKWKSFSDFELIPTKIFLDAVSGKKVEGRLKIANKSDEKVLFSVKKVVSSSGEIPGYEPLPAEVKVNLPDKIKLSPNMIKEIRFSVAFPDKPDYSGKNYLFWIEIEKTPQELIKFSLRSGVFITVK